MISSVASFPTICSIVLWPPGWYLIHASTLRTFWFRMMIEWPLASALPLVWPTTPGRFSWASWYGQETSSRHRIFLQFFINSVFHSENTYFDQWHEVNLMKFEINKTQCHVICLLGLHLVYSFRTEHAVRLCFRGRIVYISTMVNDRFSWSNYISVCWGTLKRCNAYRNLLFLHLQGSP